MLHQRESYGFSRYIKICGTPYYFHSNIRLRQHIPPPYRNSSKVMENHNRSAKSETGGREREARKQEKIASTAVA